MGVFSAKLFLANFGGVTVKETKLGKAKISDFFFKMGLEAPEQ